MNLQDLANIFTIIEATAVVVTLVAIFFQIKQTNSLNMSNSYQQLTAAYNEVILGIAENKDLHDLYLIGKEAPEKLNEVELARFYLITASILTFYESLFFLREKNLIADDQFSGWKRALAGNLEQLGYKRYWVERSYRYSTGFQEFVGNLLKNLEREKST